MDEQVAAQHVGVGVSLALTLISGVSTGIGGLIAALLGRFPSFRPQRTLVPKKGANTEVLWGGGEGCRFS